MNAVAAESVLLYTSTHGNLNVSMTSSCLARTETYPVAYFQLYMMCILIELESLALLSHKNIVKIIINILTK